MSSSYSPNPVSFNLRLLLVSLTIWGRCKIRLITWRGCRIHLFHSLIRCVRVVVNFMGLRADFRHVGTFKNVVMALSRFSPRTYLVALIQTRTHMSPCGSSKLYRLLNGGLYRKPSHITFRRLTVNFPFRSGTCFASFLLLGFLEIGQEMYVPFLVSTYRVLFQSNFFFFLSENPFNYDENDLGTSKNVPLSNFARYTHPLHFYV